MLRCFTPCLCVHFSPSWLLVVVGAASTAAAIFSFPNERHKKNHFTLAFVFVCSLVHLLFESSKSSVFNVAISLYLLPPLPSPAITFDVAVFYSTFRCISQCSCSPFLFFLSISPRQSLSLSPSQSCTLSPYNVCKLPSTKTIIYLSCSQSVRGKLSHMHKILRWGPIYILA